MLAASVTALGSVGRLMWQAMQDSRFLLTAPWPGSDHIPERMHFPSVHSQCRYLQRLVSAIRLLQLGREAGLGELTVLEASPATAQHQVGSDSASTEEGTSFPDLLGVSRLEPIPAERPPAQDQDLSLCVFALEESRVKLRKARMIAFSNCLLRSWGWIAHSLEAHQQVRTIDICRHQKFRVLDSISARACRGVNQLLLRRLPRSG